MMPVSEPIAVIGRTRWALDAAHRLLARGARIGLVITSKPERFYNCDVSDFAGLAKAANAPFIDATTLHATEFSDAVARVPCRIAISVNWPRVLDAHTIGLFPLGVLNAHAGDLPRYRGNACPNWAILNGEDHIGLCVHLMEAGHLDSGPVVLREYLRLEGDTDIGDVYRWLDESVPKLLSDAALDLLASRVTPVPQVVHPASSLRCYPRRPEDGRVAWQKSAIDLHRLVRASSRPFEGAFAFLEDGRRLTIWRASVFAHPGPFCAVPGQIMLRHEGMPIVSCGEGCIALREVELASMLSQEALAFVGRSLRARLL